MTKEIFVSLICKLRKELDDEKFNSIISLLSSNMYETKLNYIASIALGINELTYYQTGDIVYVRFEPYRLRDDLFDINHCLDHGYAEKVNGETYIKSRVCCNSKNDNVQIVYIGCDINGNEIIQDDYQISIERAEQSII